MKIYLFDVDHTMDCSRGPITFGDVHALYRDGHVVGLCGNWALALSKYLPANWRGVLTFIGPMSMTKIEFMQQIRGHVSAEDYILVGNDPIDFPGQEVSNDIEAARGASWRFIRERDFSAGVR